jgi:hypothetical protein
LLLKNFFISRAKSDDAGGKPAADASAKLTEKQLEVGNTPAAVPNHLRQTLQPKAVTTIEIKVIILLKL